MTDELEFTTLADEAGPVLRFVPGERDGLPIADVAAPADGRSVADAARAATEQLPGWLLATEDGTLVEELRKGGAHERRHAFVMTAPIPAPGQQPEGRSDGAGLDIVPLPGVAELYPSWRRAYPPGHPDFEPGPDDEVIARCWAHVDTDDYRRAMHRSSAAVRADGRVVAGIIVDRRPEPSPYGGPWISDIWVDPEHAGRGIGAVLIRRSQRQLAEDGESTLGLAVTDGNPARRVYERTGFVAALESWTLRLPN